MARDPFSNLPPIPADDRLELDEIRTPDHVEVSGDVSAGSPPRTLLKNLGKWAVPGIAAALGIWLFLPEDQNATRRAATSASVEVDTARQADETAAMMKNMKEEAAKKPVIAVPVMPGSLPASSAAQTRGPGPVAAQSGVTGQASQQGAYTPGQASQPGVYTPASAPPLPPGYSATANGTVPTPGGEIDKEAAQRAQSAYEMQKKRQEEIRASAIEVSKVKLVGQSGSDGTAQPAALSGLQSEISDAAKVAAAGLQQQQMQERILASMTPKEPGKSKGANEDFLAANAAASNNDAQLTKQMSPQASTLVSEGHVIRSVLLTRVNSDLPGRVIARVTSDVYDSNQRHIVIPKGSQLIGTYSSQIVVGQERLLMAMNRLILPNGNWISLSGAGAADMSGMSGVKADVNNHFMKMFGSSLVLGASTLLLPRQDTTVSTLQGMASGGSSGTAGSIFATSLNEVLKSLLERNKQIAPTLSLGEGQEFVFLVAHDMAMVPYRP
jgi:type IV secretory pathway VirB10-like protein